VALLVGPGGVRLHWMTDGDDDWTGLGPDNAVDEPTGRRGAPRLRPGEWNSARLSVAGGVAALEVNGEVVYEHRLAGWDDRLFGFFHFKDRAEARARGVVLKGDWGRRPVDEGR